MTKKKLHTTMKPNILFTAKRAKWKWFDLFICTVSCLFTFILWYTAFKTVVNTLLSVMVEDNIPAVLEIKIVTKLIIYSYQIGCQSNLKNWQLVEN